MNNSILAGREMCFHRHKTNQNINYSWVRYYHGSDGNVVRTQDSNPQLLPFLGLT